MLRLVSGLGRGPGGFLTPRLVFGRLMPQPPRPEVTPWLVSRRAPPAWHQPSAHESSPVPRRADAEGGNRDGCRDGRGERFHKDNLRHLSRFPVISLVTFRILSNVGIEREDRTTGEIAPPS